MMKNLYKIAMAVFLTASTSAMSFADHLGDKLTFSAKMDGLQEVPTVTTTGQGVATMVLNGTRDTLCVSVYTAGIPESINGIHLHSGEAGENGAVVYNLTPNLINGNVQTIITGSDLTSALITDMIEGGIYVNAHTASNPDGEIRGQVKLESDLAYRANLSGLQEVPIVVTQATGLGVFNLSLDKKTLMYSVTTDGLSGPITGAHLHMGSAGTNGAVVVDLTPSISGNSIQGTADVSGVSGFDTDLAAEDIYVNIHTDANPNGEIRGQLEFDDQLAFDGMLSGDQEVPAVSTNATGTAQFSLSNDFTSIEYAVQVEGLSGPITGAHLHNEEAGANGAVVVDLTNDIDGNEISGTISGSGVNQSLIIEMLKGNVYVNIHTDANPNGEIRAQIYRVAREGYSVNLSGDQEVPAASTSANGGGVVTISRERDHAHVMVVVKDLSGPIQASHIHNAAVGANGGVEFNLTPWFAGNEDYDGAYGYLTANDATPMNSAAETKFRMNEMYVNVHTANFPDGEVRGQVIRGSMCSDMTLGVEKYDEINKNNFVVYPNPTSGEINLSFDSIDGDQTVTITDMFGKTVQTAIVSTNAAKLDITQLPKGVYMLKVGNSIQKIIKR